MAWKVEARQPAARVRLCAIAAQASQAALAANFPDGRWASGPFFRSAMTCSTMAWPRWQASACSIVSGDVGEHGVVAVARDQLALTGFAAAGLRRLDPAHDQPGGDLPAAAGR